MHVSVNMPVVAKMVISQDAGAEIPDQDGNDGKVESRSGMTGKRVTKF